MVHKKTTIYAPGYAICNKCRENITADQIAKEGHYNCAICSDDYHNHCVDDLP